MVFDSTADGREVQIDDDAQMKEQRTDFCVF